MSDERTDHRASVILHQQIVNLEEIRDILTD